MKSPAKPIWFAAYFTSSAAFVLLNRAILRDFQRPVLVTAFQQSCVAAISSIYISYQARQRTTPGISIKGFRTAMPCAGLFLLMVVLNNYCLRFTTVPGYVIARATTLVFNIILSISWLGISCSTEEILSCCLVVGALFVGAGSIQLNSSDSLGLLTGVASSFCQASFSCVIANIMNKSTVTPLNLLGHYTITSAIVLLIATFLGLEVVQPGGPSPPWGLLFLSGGINAVVALSAVSSLQTSNPITVNLLGYGKSCLQTLLGIWVLGEPLEANKMVAVLMTISGAVWYTRVRAKIKAPKEV